MARLDRECDELSMRLSRFKVTISMTRIERQLSGKTTYSHVDEMPWLLRSNDMNLGRLTPGMDAADKELTVDVFIVYRDVVVS